MPQHRPHHLTAEEIEVRIWGFVVILVSLILAGIVFALLYSVTFVVQPIKSMAPIDVAYTKMLNDIVLLIVGGIGGVMSKNKVGSVARTMAAEQPQPPAVTVTPAAVPSPSYTVNAMPTWVNPPLDEDWVAPPPPKTPPNHLESEDFRAELAAARAEPK